MSRKDDWFSRGADELQRAYGLDRQVYVCPLCKREFDAHELDALTYEHVPPASLGGRELVLTCKACNNWAGSELDAHMRLEADALEFIRGRRSEPLRATLSAGGHKINIDAQSTDEGHAFFGLPEQNKPETFDAFWRAFERASEAKDDGWQMRLSLTGARFHPGRASAGWLRCAYLVAFASLGYPYVLHSQLDIVRAQIRNPTERVIEVFELLMPSAPDDARQILVAAKTPELPALVVQFGKRLLILPGPDDTDVYERLVELRKVSESQDFEGDVIAWPSEPLHPYRR